MKSTFFILLIFCNFFFFFFFSAHAQVEFINFKKVYEVQNRLPSDSLITTFQARDLNNPTGARIDYELLSKGTQLPLRLDRYSGQLFTEGELTGATDELIPITVVATNLLFGQNSRGTTSLKITAAFNKFEPVFPTNGSTVSILRNATRSQTVWIADTTDADLDEANNDIIYRVESISPEGFLEFIAETGELKLLKAAKEFSDKPVQVALVACNRPEARPPRCTTGYVSVKLDIPQLNALLDSLNDISAEKLSALANAVEIMSEYAKTDVKVAQSMVTVVSAVLDVDAVKLDSVMSSDVSTKLTNSVGAYANDAVIPTDQCNLRLQANNVEINLLDVNSDFTDSMLKFSTSSTSEAWQSPNSASSNNISFNVPTNVVRSGSTGSDGAVRVSLVRYENFKLFKLAATEPEVIRNTVINCTRFTIPDSPVLVAVVKGANTEKLREPVTFKMPKPTHNLKYKCAYWDEEGSRWATEGVTVSRQSGDEIECKANHMTAFSVLFDPTPDAGIDGSHEFALSLISYIGCGLSIFGCLATVITYCFFRHLHADHAGKILINLCVAIGLLNVTFIVGSLMSLLPVKVPCAVMSGLIHFFSLASFMWMGIEAFNMYQLLIRVFFITQEKHFVLKRAILGWGVPVVVAVSTTLLELYNGEDTPYGDECRLTPRNFFVYYAAFLAPFAIIIFCNTIVFIMVIFVLCRPRPDFANVAADKKAGQSKSIKGAQVHGTLAVMFLLGVTWIFGAMAVSHARLLFQYVFCLTNSIQGFLIFVFRCLERQEARASWIRFFKTGERRRPPASSSRSVAFSSTGSDNRGKNTSSTGKNVRGKNVQMDAEPDLLAEKPLLHQRPQRPQPSKSNGQTRLQSAFMEKDCTLDHIDQD